MKTADIKLFVEGFLDHIGLNPNALKIAYKELNDGKVHFVCTAARMQVKTLYGYLKGSEYMVTDCAPDIDQLLDLENPQVLEEERTFTLAVFSSPSKRIRTLNGSGNLVSVYLAQKVSPLIIIVPHPKDGRWATKFDFQIYESDVEAIKGELCADIAIQFISMFNPTHN